MSNWDIIVPVETVNLVTNPSFEAATTGYTFDGGNTGVRSNLESKFGLSSCLGTYQDDLNLARYAITLTAAAHTFSAWVYLGAAWDGGAVRLAMENFAGSAITTATTTTTTVSTWVRLQITVTPVGGDLVGDLVVEAASAPTAGRGLFIDGIQCEALSYSTTYCDGDQDGCEWNGTRHASTSTRSAQSRAGGRVYDLDTQYGLKLGKMIGIGAAPQSPDYEEHAGHPGGTVSGVKTHGRVFTLAGVMYSTTSFADLHDQRQALYSILDPGAVPHTADGPQPVILRYRGATVEKEIACHYEGGFEGTFNADARSFERIALRFLAPDPFWYQIGQTAAVLDSNDTATMYYIAARLRSTGQWSNLGITANPNGGTGCAVILRASDGVVYFGGNFTGFDGNAGWDYLVKFTPSTDTWERVGGASDITNYVSALAEGVDGTIYIGGGFQNVIDANGDYLVQYDGTSITSVAGGGTGDVNALAVGLDGLLYIGGNFVAWDADGDQDDISTWNGAVYAAAGVGAADLVFDIVVGPDGTIYCAENTGGVEAYNPTTGTWAYAGGGALSDDAYAVTVDSGGRLYAGGVFLNASSNASADRIAYTDGQFWANMQTGANGNVWKLAAAPDDMIYAVGQFTTLGSLTAPDRAGKWNGSAFLPLDLNLSGSGIVNTIVTGPADPTVPTNYDLWLGAADTGAAYFAGTTTITNNGTAPIYPKFVVYRSGGTSARLINLRNETTGKELSFNYSLLDGETLTVDMDPQSQTVTSDFFGSRFDAYLTGGDLGTWSLQPGSNQITCFVDVAGAPTVTAYLLWSNAYKAAD